MTIRMSSAEYAAYATRLATRFKPAMIRGIRAGAMRVVAFMQQRTRTAPPANPAGVGTGGAVNTGAYLRSWRSIPLPEGAEVTNISPYSAIIEHGRRMGAKFPPKQPLIDWIKRRILGPREAAKKKKKGKAKGPRTSGDKTRDKADENRRSNHPKRPEPHGPQRPRPEGPSRPSARSMSLDKEAKRLYFPIARAIARRGLIGRKILTDANIEERIRDYVRTECRRELQKEIDRR